MFYKLILLYTIVLPFSNCFQHYDEFLDKQIFNTFKDSRDSVPKYQVVPISHTLHKRDAQPKIKLTAFDQDFKLYLEPNSNLLIGKNTPVYLSYKNSSKKTGVQYIKFNHDLDVKVFHDMNNKAAIMISENAKKQVEIHGTIGNNYVIRPIPLHIKEKLINKKQNGANGYWNKSPIMDYKNNSQWKQSFEDNEYHTTHHIVMKIPEKETNGKNRVTETPNKKFGKSKIRFRRDVVNDVYPEILVISDYETLVAHGKDIKEVIKYNVVFWNGVDLRYRSVTEPRIRLNVAGIVVAMESSATPYLESARLDKNHLLDDDALATTGRFFYNEDEIPQNSYDIVVAITNLDMVSKTNTGISNATRGIAYYAQVCQRMSFRKSFDSVAIVEDNTKFSGILAAAHEVAHLMGASHDGDTAHNPNIPGAKNCPFDDGYLMSYRRINENSFKWSACTLASFKYLLSQPQTQCLRNKPNIKQPYPKVLPGSIASLEDQCNARIPKSTPCFTDESVCQSLFCRMPGSSMCATVEGAVEGSPCANSKGICLNGKCVIPPKDFGKI